MPKPLRAFVTPAGCVRAIKKMITRVGLLFFILFGSSAFAESLIVYGTGFTFSIKEPTGWVGDTENAEKYHANIIFYPKKENSNGNNTVIRISVNKKVDENTKADLDYDAKGYRKKYPSVEFRDITLKHENYKIFSSIFFIPNDFYEYVAYINPGSHNNELFSASMNKQKTKATLSELNAYREAIASLVLF